MKRLQPTGSTSGAAPRNGPWRSPDVLVPAAFFVLIAAFGIYLALPGSPEPSGVSIQARSTRPATEATKRTISANQPKPEQNAIGSPSPTQHAVYGTPGTNIPAAASPAPGNFLPIVSVAPHSVRTTSEINGDRHLVPTTRVDKPSAPTAPPPAVSKPFTITNDTEVVGESSDAMDADSTADCEQKCAKAPSACNLFAFNKETKECFLYTSGELRKNPLFDYGARTMRGIHVETVRPDVGGLRTGPVQQK